MCYEAATEDSSSGGTATETQPEVATNVVTGPVADTLAGIENSISQLHPDDQEQVWDKLHDKAIERLDSEFGR